jgi:flagellin-like hook-associated protein FlgL
MAISSVGSTVAPLLQSVLNLDNQLQDLQRQLATGDKSETYSGLGAQSGVTVGLNAQLSAISGFESTISTVGNNLSIAQTALSQVASVASTVKTATVQPIFDLDNSGHTSAQNTAADQLDQIVSALNTQGGNGYLFSGSGVNQRSVESSDHILNGNGAQAGLRQLIAERNQADVGGPGGLGRLVIPAVPPVPGTVVSVSEDVAGSPFGFKLVGANSSLTGATVTGPTGSPAGISVDLGAGNPNDGDNITYTFSLPDGTTEQLKLTATTSSSPGPNQFAIGATPAATAVNLQAALTAGVGQLAQTSLTAASAMAAADNFFNTDATHPPLRVAGTSPFYAATSLVAGTPANTVSWYTGENGASPSRSTATARIDPSLTVSYGARANEEGIRWVVQNVAVLAATSYSASNANASASYSALNQRIDNALAVPPGVQSVQDIQASLASAQTAMTDATARHKQTQQTLTDMLQNIEGVSNDQVGAQILSLQTSLSASLSVTARLAQMSLLNYLAPTAV